MYFHNAYKELVESDAFKKFKDEHKDAFLSVGFIMLGEENIDWQFGFYDKEKDLIYTFFVNKDSARFDREDKVFKEPDKEILEIDVDKIKIDLEDVVLKLDKIVTESYPKEEITKQMLIVQKDKDLGEIWNATLITKAFNAINIKIDASDGSVIVNKIMPVMGFQKS